MTSARTPIRARASQDLHAPNPRPQAARRSLLAGGAAAALAAAGAARLLPAALPAGLVSIGAAHAQAFPAKPIVVVSPFAPGGADIFLRTLAPKLTEALGQPIVIENVAGASGLIGSERVARAPADGYTLLFAPSSASITAPLLSKQAKVDFLRDFTPIMASHESLQVLFVHPDLPVKTVKELIDYAKTHRDKLSFGSAGIGSVMHLNGEMFNISAGVDLLHVPFKGISAMMNDTLSGRIPVGFSTYASTAPHIKAGKLRALAVLDDKPSAHLPGVPPITEALPSFGPSGTWVAILAPAGLPRDVQARLHQAWVKALSAPDVRQWFEQNFASIFASTPEELTERLRRDIQRTRRLMQSAGIQPE